MRCITNRGLLDWVTSAARGHPRPHDQADRDPETRYREDPVRMLVRGFEAKMALPFRFGAGAFAPRKPARHIQPARLSTVPNFHGWIRPRASTVREHVARKPLPATLIIRQGSSACDGPHPRGACEYDRASRGPPVTTMLLFAVMRFDRLAATQRRFRVRLHQGVARRDAVARSLRQNRRSGFRAFFHPDAQLLARQRASIAAKAAGAGPARASTVRAA